MHLPPGTTGTVESVETKSTTTSYAANYLPQADPNRIYRIVGFLEYAKALESLDQLAALINEYELAAIDDIDKSEPEFTVYTNIARRLELGRSTLAERTQNEKDDFARRGFKWVTALARVELGAMLAGFTEHPQPFAAVAGQGYDRAEFKELLLDGSKMHFWALTQDPGFTEIMRRLTPTGTTLAYLRRLNVALAFVYALGATSGAEMTPAQQQEVAVYANKLDGSRQDIRQDIERYLNQVLTSSKTTTSKAGNSLLEACYKGVCRELKGSIR